MRIFRQIHAVSELGEYRRFVKRYGYNTSYVQITPGALDLQAFEIRVDGCAVVQERFGCQVLARGSSATAGYAVMLAASGVERFFGDEVSSKKVVLFSPGCEIDAIAFPGTTNLHYLLSARRVEAAAKEWAVEVTGSSRALVVSPGIDRLRRLRSALGRINEIVDRRDLSTWPEAEQELVETFVGLFDVETLGDVASEGRKRAGVEHAIKVHSYICSCPADELDLDSLAEDLGVTRHHVNRCFRQHYDVSVHEFVNLCHLHQARNLLLEDRSRTSVTETAYACGFNHLGRFSAEYKKLFAESPSETLQQATRP